VINWIFVNTSQSVEVALYSNNQLYYESSHILQGTMSMLLPMCDKLLKRANVQLKDISKIGLCIGPGSFTGLRVGMGTVKAWGQVYDLPIVPITSNQLNAYNVYVDNIDIHNNITVASIVGGGAQACYVALYDYDKVLSIPQCIKVSSLDEWLIANKHDIVVFDSNIGNKQATQLRQERILLAMSNCCGVTDYNNVQPLYVRQPQPLRQGNDV
jgi:tRNA threonylcarbamoyl adenosine modification protein YeaZ